MIPHPYWRLAETIHQERIQATQRPRPEWPSPTRPARQIPAVHRQLRMLLAVVLRRLAILLEPNESAQQPVSSRGQQRTA